MQENIPKWIRKLIVNTLPQAGAYKSNWVTHVLNPNASSLLDMYLIRSVDLGLLEKSSV